MPLLSFSLIRKDTKDIGDVGWTEKHRLDLYKMANKQFCHCVMPGATRGYRVGTDFTELPLTVPAVSCSFVFPPPQQLSVQHVPALPTHKHYWWLFFFFISHPAECVCRDGCSLPLVEIQNSRIRTVCLISAVPSRPFLQQCLKWRYLCVVSHGVELSVNGYISNWTNRLWNKTC